MAAQEKIPSSTGSDLDVLIHSLEYENQQYVKMIEKENQRNTYLESQEEEKLRFIAELQTQIASLEADTKNNHKQLVHNKNTLESLRKSKCVLQAHKDALLKHLDTVQFENNEQQRELGDAVQMYEKTWTDYKAHYQSLALYQRLLEEEQRLAQTQAEHSKWQQQKTQLQTEIRRAQDELDFREWNRFCIKIAEKWVMIGRKKEELLDAVREKETLQSKLKEIREKNTSALVTSHDASQDMDMDSSQTEASEKEVVEEEVTEGDLTLLAGDGGDTGGVEEEKENLATEQQLCDGPETAVTGSSSNQTFTVPHTLATTGPAVNSVVLEERMEEDGGKTREIEPPDYIDRFEPSDTSSPVVTGPRSGMRRPLQPLQLTSTPRMSYRPPTLSVPKIGLGMRDGYDPRLHTSAPPTIDLLRKVVPSAGVAKCVPAVTAHSRPPPPQLSVPLLTLPRPSLPPPSPPQIPTVRSAVSSLLMGARPAMDKLPKPAPPRIHLPRTPLPAPTPLPVLGRFPRPVEKGSSGGEAAQSGQSKPASSVFTVAHPTAGEQRQGCGKKSSVPDSTGPALDVPVAEAPELGTPGAGDAPPVQRHDKTDAPSDKLTETDDNSAKQAPEDEEMESDSDSRGPSQPSISSSQLSEGRLSQGPEGHFSQGPMNAYSPFSLDRHKQKLLEINDDSEDSFNFEQRNLFCTTDKAEDQPMHSAASASSIFNLAFVTSASVAAAEPAGAPIFKGVTSPESCPPPPSVEQAPANRKCERGGSFFSFESMDTSEPIGGLSLLSMFGSTDKEPQPEPAFSFAFDNSSADSGNASAFSFSFGGGRGRGGEEQSSGSVFSLF